ncbi:hypothetical protein LZG04_09320 [Saccharothrix sp. S26]|uniref:hypothetical protein n=1 Tax=Saccharothrix sp. S26 TaxID=2907215 RepID=UPI001F310CB2|nr:hypothetical protein [Saccharothrix sp. S26]MCE6995005.1 hypothetical protein [Saccharothrix sp. S26]
MAAALAAAPAAASPGPDRPTRIAAGGFVADPGVVDLGHRVTVGEVVIRAAATPPESFCYVSVVWPQIGADRTATGTWSLDCRSLANPSLPAPDIEFVLMDVRVFQGEYNPYLPGTEVSHKSCSSGRTTPSCSSTTPGPLMFGVPYYTRLDVAVTLRGGTSPVGAFVTDAVRLT